LANPTTNQARRAQVSFSCARLTKKNKPMRAKFPPKHIPALLPETQTFLTNIIAASGGPNITQESLQAADRFVRDCYNAGIWTKLLEVYPIMGSTLQAAMVKLKYVTTATLTNNNFVAGDYTERGSSGGLNPDGTTKFLNTNFLANAIPAAAHLSAYIREDTSGASAYFIGANNAAVTEIAGIVSTVGTNRHVILGATVSAGDANGITKGFYYGERASAISLELFKDNASIGTSNTNVVPAYPAINVYLFARNNNGAAVSFQNKRASFFSIGTNMTAAERSALYNAVVNLQANLQRNV
jgi:hypothetical protein